MPLLSVQNLTCTQGAKTLFETISCAIDEGEKVALIGINGSGKSTLLNHIVTMASERQAHIITQQGLKITYLPQMPLFNPEDTILDHLFSSETPTSNVIRNYHCCLEKPHNDTELTALLSQMDLHQAWDYEARVSSVLSELQITNLTQKMKTLSGGMIKKIGLAQLFFEETDLLIMDEPTNHLDIETIAWLETMLKRINTTLLMVTHDRYFLDKICTKIFEIDQQTLFTYRGNYQSFLEQKAERVLSQQKAEDSIQAIMRVELEWLKRGPKARSTKQKARKQRIEDMQNRDTRTEETPIELGVAGRRLGKKILELKNVTKSFDNRILINQFSYTFKHNEKIGILGPNGAGKTTLFNLVSERLLPDKGEVDIGVNTVWGYFDQHSQDLNPALTIYEHIHQIGTVITLHDGTQISATKLLERFLFPSSALKTQIGKLSGGEKRRLHLVSMLLTNPNFLLFDEPTNDLDITTLSILEDFLLTFSGCVMIISHDRYFMDRVVDQLLVFNSNGIITHFAGTYSDYAALQKENEKTAKSKIPVTKTVSPPSTEKKGLTNAEQNEFKKLEADIITLEEETKRLNMLFSNIKTSTQEFEKAGKDLKEITQKLDSKVERWEHLARES